MVDTEGASASVCGGTGGVFPQPAEVRRHCPLRHRGPGIPQGHSQSSQARLERQEETATWGSRLEQRAASRSLTPQTAQPEEARIEGECTQGERPQTRHGNRLVTHDRCV